jgi:hypothetical protein
MTSNDLKYPIIFVFFIAISCLGKESNIKNNCNQIYVDTLKEVSLQKINKPFVVGNFDGNGTKDTIFFHYYSYNFKTEIDSIPSLDNNWDNIIDWFNQLYQIETYLTYKEDTLYLGSAYGLFYLLNIGDINSDGKDEIAIVVNWLDYSKINSCKIYSICNYQWEILKEFTIHESAFDTSTINASSKCLGISGYLEKENNTWKYCSYENKIKNIDKFEVLYLDKCNSQ